MAHRINVSNNFGFLSDEEAEDNDALLKKAIEKKNAKLDQKKKALTEKAASEAAFEAEPEIARNADVIFAERPAGRDRTTEHERHTGLGRGNRDTRALRSDHHTGAESTEKDGHDEQFSHPSHGDRGRGGDRSRLPRNEESDDATTQEQSGESAVDVPRTISGLVPRKRNRKCKEKVNPACKKCGAVVYNVFHQKCHIGSHHVGRKMLCPVDVSCKPQSYLSQHIRLVHNVNFKDLDIHEKARYQETLADFTKEINLIKSQYFS